MADVYPRAAPFAGRTDAPSGHTHAPFPLTSADMLRHAGAAAAAMLVVASVFFVWRRLAGALAAPLPAGEILFAGALVTGLAGLAHRPTAMRRDMGMILPMRDALTTLALAGIGIAMSRLGANVLALVVFWALIAGEELWTWRRFAPRGLVRTGRRPAAPKADRNESEDALRDDEEPLEPEPNVIQQLTRRTTESGEELSGWLRMTLVAGQRTGSLHVAFCPPFESCPAVQTEVVSGPECRIKTAQSLPYGARLDVKLTAAVDEGESVLIWFFASSDHLNP